MNFKNYILGVFTAGTIGCSGSNFGDWSVSKDLYSLDDSSSTVLRVSARTNDNLSPNGLLGYDNRHKGSYDAICLLDRNQGGCFDARTLQPVSVQVRPLFRVSPKPGHTTFTEEQIRKSLSLLEMLSEGK